MNNINATKYNPEIHHRRSVRLKGYDYSQCGLYFITICVKNGERLFGEIINGEMFLNDLGALVENEWQKTAELRKNVILHEYVVMPNHFHCILEIATVFKPTNRVGAYCIRPENNATNIVNENIPDKGVCNTPLRSPSQTVGAIVRGFKSAVSRQIGNSIFQRNFHEHIIRNWDSFIKISQYITNNPVNWENDRFYK